MQARCNRPEALGSVGSPVDFRRTVQPEIDKLLPSARRVRPHSAGRVCGHPGDAQGDQQLLRIVLEPGRMTRLQHKPSCMRMAETGEESRGVGLQEFPVGRQLDQDGAEL